MTWSVARGTEAEHRRSAENGHSSYRSTMAVHVSSTVEKDKCALTPISAPDRGHVVAATVLMLLCHLALGTEANGAAPPNSNSNDTVLTLRIRFIQVHITQPIGFTGGQYVNLNLMVQPSRISEAGFKVPKTFNKLFSHTKPEGQFMNFLDRRDKAAGPVKVNDKTEALVYDFVNVSNLGKYGWTWADVGNPIAEEVDESVCDPEIRVELFDDSGPLTGILSFPMTSPTTHHSPNEPVYLGAQTQCNSASHHGHRSFNNCVTIEVEMTCTNRSLCTCPGVTHASATPGRVLPTADNASTTTTVLPAADNTSTTTTVLPAADNTSTTTTMLPAADNNTSTTTMVLPAADNTGSNPIPVGRGATSPRQLPTSTGHNTDTTTDASNPSGSKQTGSMSSNSIATLASAAVGVTLSLTAFTYACVIIHRKREARSRVSSVSSSKSRVYEAVKTSGRRRRHFRWLSDGNFHDPSHRLELSLPGAALSSSPPPRYDQQPRLPPRRREAALVTQESVGPLTESIQDTTPAEEQCRTVAYPSGHRQIEAQVSVGIVSTSGNDRTDQSVHMYVTVL